MTETKWNQLKSVEMSCRTGWISVSGAQTTNCQIRNQKAIFNEITISQLPNVIVFVWSKCANEQVVLMFQKDGLMDIDMYYVLCLGIFTALWFVKLS